MGSELLTTGSVVAAFLAGGVALFAPCCIVFLAPSYLAGAVKNRRWRLLPLTFVFAAGLALVLLPLTLGMSLLAGAIARYHAPLYYAGGALMIALAVLALSGRMWSLPSAVRAPDTSRGDSASFFALGVFSGIASACCAPVLAGVMTLSVLSGSAVGGLVLGLAYVFGMVFPLFVMALVWDRARLGERRFWRARPIRIRLAGRTLVTNTVNLIVAVGFLVMGGFIIALANSPEMTGGTPAQAWIAARLTGAFLWLQQWAAPVPEPVQALIVLTVAGLFVWATLTDRRRPRTGGTAKADADRVGHDHCAGHDGHDHVGSDRGGPEHVPADHARTDHVRTHPSPTDRSATNHSRTDRDSADHEVAEHEDTSPACHDTSPRTPRWTLDRQAAASRTATRRSPRSGPGSTPGNAAGADSSWESGSSPSSRSSGWSPRDCSRLAHASPPRPGPPRTSPSPPPTEAP